MPEEPTVAVVEEEEEEVYSCNFCGDEAHIDTLFYHDGGDSLWCEECFSEQHCPCAWCGEYAHNEDIMYVENGDPVCSSCQEDVRSCEHCGSTMHIDDMVFTDYSVLCYSCWEDEDNQGFIRDWGDKPEVQFINDDSTITYRNEPNAYYMGMEIELEGTRTVSVKDVLEPVWDEVAHCYVSTDSSLHNGLELVTHPGTFEAWRRGYVIRWDAWHE